MNDRTFRILAGLAFVALLTFSLGGYLVSRHNCDERGGALVRGAVWWTCVATPENHL